MPDWIEPSLEVTVCAVPSLLVQVTVSPTLTVSGVGSKAKFTIEATPKAGWHVYSAIPSEDGAYQPAVLGWDITSRGFETEAKLEEKGGLIEAFDEIMNGTVRYYKGVVVFSQEMKLTEKEVLLEGFFDYMACNDEKCIPLTAEIKFEAKAKE